MLIILACLDLMFTATLGYTFIATMGLEGDGSRTAAAVIAGLWVVKVIAWLLIISKKLKPLARWFSTPQAATDPDTIREVAITLYRAPFSVSAIWAVAFGGTCMLNTLVLYFVCAGSVPLGPRAIEAQVFSNLGILLGAAEMTFPLTEWLLAPMIESVSLAAQARAVEIPGHGLTFRSRLVVFALALALAPSLFLSGIAYMNDARAEQRDLTRQAELAAAEAALGHDAAAQVAGGWTFTYDAAALEARSTRTTTAAGITGRDAAQALADRPHLTRMFERAAAETATGSVTHPREGVVAFRTEGGRRVGVVIPRVASAAFSTLMLLLMALAVVALWGPLSALFIGNSTAVPVVRLSNALTRVGAGEVADAPKVPVFHQDEVGTLARSYNAMLDQLREFARRVNEVSKGDLAVELQVRGDLGNALRDQVTSLRDIVSHIAQSAMQLAGAASEMYAAAQE
ncbi:MAG TPA: HAMP domain-containing protein [Kofleriaceae bacterium]|nr:HAMP domain-containing protein [Kofleriaceae bacterium]